MNHVITHLQNARRDKTRVAVQKLFFHLIGTGPQHPVHQNVTQVADMLENVRQIGGQSRTAFDAFALKQVAPVQIVRHLDQCLGGHATDPGTGRAQFTAVDQ